METYKAHLVIKSYRQHYGIDYDEIFSPIAMLKSIRIMLVIAGYKDYEIWQMDVKIAFLNGELQEEVYTIQPKGFTSAYESKVCKLQRSIYRLKQASRSWNMHFDKVIRMYSFIRNEKESCIYKWINDSMVVFLILYVDNILLIENDIPALQEIKVWLSSQFSMKDMRKASYILGMKIYELDRKSCLDYLSPHT